MISLRKSLLLAGAATLLIGTPVIAAKMGHGPDHMGGRLFDMVDANKDGKVTKEEADKASVVRFKKVSGGKSTISQSQFAAFKPERPGAEDRKDDAFKRIDWNSDGVLSLEEFSAVPHARFIRADRDGSGVVNCTPKRPMRGEGEAMPAPPADEAGAPPPDGMGHHRRGMHGMRGMMARAQHEACVSADADKSGTLTRAELDSSLAANFAAATNSGSSMTPAQFDTVMEDRRADRRKAGFKRLDKNNDGKLSQEEFSAPGSHMFAMMDKNKDGVVEKSELSHRGFKHRMKPEAN